MMDRNLRLLPAWVSIMPRARQRSSPFIRSIANLAATCLVAAIVASGSIVQGDERVVVSFPMVATEPTHRIVAIDPAKRQARVELVPGSLPGLMPTEGQAILVIAGTEGGPLDSLVRVEIDELLEGNVAMATFGTGAVGAIRTGPAVLARPFAGLTGDEPAIPAPTKSIRSLPDLLTVGAADADAADDPKAILRARDAGRRKQSLDHLKKLSAAFHSFADAYGRFPPAAVIGPDGKPWHSWRVLLLPFLEEAGLYQQYDFSQPWDSPKNRPLAERTVKVYRDPAREGPPDGFTDYAAIVGKNAVFQPNAVKMESGRDFPACLIKGKKISYESIPDGTPNTIMFATVDPSRRIPWTKPEDILLDDDFPGLGKPKGIGALHPAGEGGGRMALVGFTDGAVIAFPSSIDKDDVVKMLTRNGGEEVDRNALLSSASGGREGPPVVKVVTGGKGQLRLEID